VSKELARTLAARALAAGRRGDWPGASAIVQQINDELGGTGTMFAVCGWCDTLAATAGVSERDQLALGWLDPATGEIRLSSEGVPARTLWAAQLITARAALDKPMFDALIAALPADRAVIGSHVGAVLETVVATLDAGARTVTRDAITDGGVGQ
jgi:hypothetical protein